MSTLSSKPTKTFRPVDYISVFVFLGLILTRLVIPFTGNIYSSLSSAFSVDRAQAGVSNVTYSFTADQQYWSANCSHGWTSDTTCDNIVTRSQACSISTESAYCSEYESYLEQSAK
jgi:hypothetical protein